MLERLLDVVSILLMPLSELNGAPLSLKSRAHDPIAECSMQES